MFYSICTYVIHILKQVLLKHEFLYQTIMISFFFLINYLYLLPFTVLGMVCFLKVLLSCILSKTYSDVKCMEYFSLTCTHKIFSLVLFHFSWHRQPSWSIFYLASGAGDKDNKCSTSLLINCNLHSVST